MQMQTYLRGHGLSILKKANHLEYVFTETRFLFRKLELYIQLYIFMHLTDIQTVLNTVPIPLEYTQMSEAPPSFETVNLPEG